jgi:hypothetical protein
MFDFGIKNNPDHDGKKEQKTIGNEHLDEYAFSASSSVIFSEDWKHCDHPWYRKACSLLEYFGKSKYISFIRTVDCSEIILLERRS